MAQATVFSRDSSDAYILNNGLGLSRLDRTTKRIVYTILPRAAIEAASLRAMEGKIQ